MYVCLISMYCMYQLIYDMLIIYVICCVRFDMSCAFAHALPRPSLV